MDADPILFLYNIHRILQPGINTTTVADDDPRLADMDPPLDTQIRKKARDIFIEEELARRKLAYILLLYKLPQLCLIRVPFDAELRRSLTPTKELKQRRKKPKSRIGSVRSKMRRSGSCAETIE